MGLFVCEATIKVQDIVERESIEAAYEAFRDARGCPPDLMNGRAVAGFCGCGCGLVVFLSEPLVNYNGAWYYADHITVLANPPDAALDRRLAAIREGG